MLASSLLRNPLALIQPFNSLTTSKLQPPARILLNNPHSIQQWKRSIVTNYPPVVNAYEPSPSKLTYISQTEKAELLLKRATGYSSNVFYFKMNRPLHLDMFKASLEYIRLRHARLQCKLVPMFAIGAVFRSNGKIIPYQLIERPEDEDMANQQWRDELEKSLANNFTLSIADNQDDYHGYVDPKSIRHCKDDYLDQPPLQCKVFYAPNQCDMMFTIDCLIADLPASGMLIQEFLYHYSQLINYQARGTASFAIEVAPSMHSIYKILPDRFKGGFLAWKRFYSCLQCLKSLYEAESKFVQSASYPICRFQPKAVSITPQIPLYFNYTFNQETTNEIVRLLRKYSVTLESVVIAATLTAARQVLFDVRHAARMEDEMVDDGYDEVLEYLDRSMKPNILQGQDCSNSEKPILLEFNLVQDFRQFFDPALPCETLTSLNNIVYYSIQAGTCGAPELNVWKIAKQITDEIEANNQTDWPAQYFVHAELLKKLSVIGVETKPFPSFQFQSVANLGIQSDTLQHLEITDVNVAVSAPFNCCHVLISVIQQRIRLYFNYPSECLHYDQVEALAEEIHRNLMNNQPW